MKKILTLILLLMVLSITSCDSNHISIVRDTDSQEMTMSDAKPFRGKSTATAVGVDDISKYLWEEVYSSAHNVNITKIHDVSQKQGETANKMTVTCTVDVNNEFCGCSTNWTIHFERFNDNWIGNSLQQGISETILREDIDLSMFTSKIQDNYSMLESLFRYRSGKKSKSLGLFEDISANYNVEDRVIYIAFEQYDLGSAFVSKSPCILKLEFYDTPFMLTWFFTTPSGQRGTSIDSIDWLAEVHSDDEYEFSVSERYNLFSGNREELPIWDITGHYSSYSYEFDIEKKDGVYIAKNIYLIYFSDVYYLAEAPIVFSMDIAMDPAVQTSLI